ncbi:hypothetical protein [Planctomyces sp. SH-PL14]|uniref:hypothetical protein n=1 Tax=Planctomyces sp. SH-PL14 TaxID=1632864 RepID=UPI00078C436B|nr:hypothetical protein [Planctomyces sp. SH-PL14]AMV20365.1 hypothetical protein VT03_20880 [Planctomyces sp. SH-PL14]
MLQSPSLRPSKIPAALAVLVGMLCFLTADSAWARCGNLPHNWDHAAMLQPEFGLLGSTLPAGPDAAPQSPIPPKCSGPHCSEAPAPTPAPRSVQPAPVGDLIIAPSDPVSPSTATSLGCEIEHLLRAVTLIDGILRPPQG